jgi:hypothetical protein
MWRISKIEPTSTKTVGLKKKSAQLCTPDSEGVRGAWGEVFSSYFLGEVFLHLAE